MASSLYIHIPFCKGFCPYCDFPKAYYFEDQADAYLLSLFAEAKAKCHGPYRTIYFGGGTPTCLNLTQLESLLGFFAPYLAPNGEFSCEANPDSLSEEKIALLAQYGVNRVSLGVQSFSPKYLKLLGRHHDAEDVKRAVNSLREHGITNINLDLMFALPAQTVSEVQADVAKAIALKPTHISAYSLILEEGTAFFARGVKEASQDDQADQYEAVRAALEEAGYRRYEVSNFALPGFECRHNLAYWHDEDYDAIGLGASGHDGKTRYKNTVNVPDYLKGKWKLEQETLSPKEEEECYLLSNLRLVDGFALSSYKARFGKDFISEHQEAVESLMRRGLLETEAETVRATPQGLMLLDTVLVDLY
ncbi:MAG: radical SAM family heme chaperone HemW [Bacilli bacterium]|nr:radical SAM family heme chaperone HemW [Bacilli bacterium]